MRGGRGHFAAVDRGELAVRRANENQAAAADAGVIAVDDAQRERRRHRGIDRVAAVAKHLRRGVRGHRMPRRDHPPRTGRFVRGRGEVATRITHRIGMNNSRSVRRIWNEIHFRCSINSVSHKKHEKARKNQEAWSDIRYFLIWSFGAPKLMSNPFRCAQILGIRGFERHVRLPRFCRP